MAWLDNEKVLIAWSNRVQNVSIITIHNVTTGIGYEVHSYFKQILSNVYYTLRGRNASWVDQDNQ
jgi:hypothetical protein